jgi:hypothetical protein
VIDRSETTVVLLFVAGEGQRSQGKGSKGCVLDERCVNDDVMSVVKYAEWRDDVKYAEWKTPTDGGKHPRMVLWAMLTM